MTYDNEKAKTSDIAPLKELPTLNILNAIHYKLLDVEESAYYQDPASCMYIFIQVSVPSLLICFFSH